MYKVTWMDIIVVTLAAMIPFGLIMAFVTNNSNWLMFCTPLLLFLS